MSLSSIEVWQQITASGLADARQCQAWATRAAKSLSASDATDGIQLLRQLVQFGHLTKYQAKVLTGQRAGPLRIGDWEVRRTVQEPMWDGWFEVRAMHADPQTRWSKLLSNLDIVGLHSSAPSKEFAHRQASVQGKHLQQVFAPEVIEGQLAVHVMPVTGKTLADLFSRLPPDPRIATAIMRQVGGGLSSLHAAGLVHGCIYPGRICWDGRQSLLVRDPLCRYPVSVDGQEQGLIGEWRGSKDAKSGSTVPDSPEIRCAQYLAPEFAAPGQRPTSATDVYALGCLWWWLLTGKALNRGATHDQILAAGTVAVPSLPKRVALSQALERVLRCALAKKPTHRFESAKAFCLALDAALELTRSEAASAHSEMAAPDGRTSPARTFSATSQDAAQAATAVDARSAGEPAATLATAKASEGQPARAVQDAVRPKAKAKASGSRLKTGPQPSKVVTADKQTTRAAGVMVQRRKRNKAKWLLPVMGGCGLLILLMITLHFTGALRTAGSGPEPDRKPPPFVPSPPPGAVAEQNPLTDFFVIVENSETALWAPPDIPVPLTFELLPPGAQCFIALRPSRLTESGLISNLTSDDRPFIESVLGNVSRQTGLASEDILRCIFAFYSADSDGSFPRVAVRIDLQEGRELSQLQSAWDIPGGEGSSDPSLMIAGDRAYFLQKSEASEEIRSFSFGPTDLIREVAETAGAEGPLLAQVEKLRKASDSQADVVILASPPYLFTEGRGLLQAMPEKLRKLLPGLIGVDSRAALLQTRLSPDWYFEAEIIGQSNRDAGRIVEQLESQLKSLPTKVEEWFIAETPHPYWRALALRYPQMLRSLTDYTRFGVEDGVAMANTYLPESAAENLLLTTWIALQNGVTGSGPTDTKTSEVAQRPLTIDEYLARRIKVSFAQEPIEDALQLVGDEANDGLPSGSNPLRFELDGDAFQNSGITRNQQLKNFDQDNTSVRAALTEIARRGNPVTTVTDTREQDQQLIWVVKDDPQATGRQMILLTTRQAARAAGIELPLEFAP